MSERPQTLGEERPMTPRRRGRLAPGARRRGSAMRLAMALGAVALVHAGALGLLEEILPSLLPLQLASRAAPASASVAGADPEAGNAPLEIETLVDRLRTPEEQSVEERRADEEKRKIEEDRNQKGQVVDIARPAIEERPDEDARFLAEYDSKVARERRGRPGHEAAGGPEEVAAVEARHASRPAGRPAIPGEPPGSSEPSHRVPVGQLGQGGSSSEIEAQGDRPRAGAPGLPESRRGAAVAGARPGVPGSPGEAHPNLQPTDDMLVRAMARGGGSPDFLQDIDDGESTALNAKKFRFASFFNRVKRAVADQWHPDMVYLRHDASGHVYGNKDRITVVRVHLHPDGRLQTSTILQASGVEFLDDEAMDALKRAQPFVNPPPQLVDADGLIHFNFGFFFELSGHGNVKVFKYQ